MNLKQSLTATLLASTALAISPTVSYAATMVFDEVNAPGGDFSNFIIPSGYYGVTGEMGIMDNDGGDFFIFQNAPTGVQTFELSGTFENTGFEQLINFSAEFVGANPNDHNTFFNSLDGINFYGTISTPADFDGMVRFITGLEGSGVTYSVKLVSEVPLPAAAPIFALGLAGLGMARKKHKANRRG